MWIQVFLTIDAEALSKGTQFCDELGYDVKPILMVSTKSNAKKEIEPLYWAHDEITIGDISPASEDGYLVGC